MSQGLLAFVVQKHKATTPHYDFRLEIGETMASWSVPKGPSLDPAVKRLAMPTGPHELEYRHFEGVIPSEKYGAGVVMIWDEGTYTPEVEAQKGDRRTVRVREEAEEVAKASMRSGNLKFTLYGTKLHGSFALVRTTMLGPSREAWLLIKHKDENCQAGYDANDYDSSAASNRSFAEIASAGGLSDQA